MNASHSNRGKVPLKRSPRVASQGQNHLPRQQHMNLRKKKALVADPREVVDNTRYQKNFYLARITPITTLENLIYTTKLYGREKVIVNSKSICDFFCLKSFFLIFYLQEFILILQSMAPMFGKRN